MYCTFGIFWILQVLPQTNCNIIDIFDLILLFPAFLIQTSHTVNNIQSSGYIFSIHPLEYSAIPTVEVYPRILLTKVILSKSLRQVSFVDLLKCCRRSSLLFFCTWKSLARHKTFLVNGFYWFLAQFNTKLNIPSLL